MAKDFEAWVAAHDECGTKGCGSCVPMEIELEDDLAARIKEAAGILRIPVDVFILQALHEALRN